MNCCDLSLSTPEENLACDEVLLDLCEETTRNSSSSSRPAGEVLRFWETTRYFVVVGYANKVATEVNQAFCRREGIPILRRSTGGGTVVQGPGALNYSLILNFDSSGPLQSISSTNRFILERNRQALSRALGREVEIHGHTDLAIGGVKFAGNAQRRRSHSLLFHGSLLLDFDISLIEQALPMPSRQPDYRKGRRHSDFLLNLRVPASQIKASLAEAWSATSLLHDLPIANIAELARNKYSSNAWNLKF